jgi:hypothetical protein
MSSAISGSSSIIRIFIGEIYEQILEKFWSRVVKIKEEDRLSTGFRQNSFLHLRP